MTVKSQNLLNILSNQENVNWNHLEISSYTITMTKVENNNKLSFIILLDHN